MAVIKSLLPVTCGRNNHRTGSVTSPRVTRLISVASVSDVSHSSRDHASLAQESITIGQYLESRGKSRCQTKELAGSLPSRAKRGKMGLATTMDTFLPMEKARYRDQQNRA
ncbi:hypothetical protein J6590_052316 [Homalodisca vitripennis]|nr:hypothetical protein J6590_052316 [Homalodisca vitripennis]